MSAYSCFVMSSFNMHNLIVPCQESGMALSSFVFVTCDRIGCLTFVTILYYIEGLKRFAWGCESIVVHPLRICTWSVIDSREFVW